MGRVSAKLASNQVSLSMGSSSGAEFIKDSGRMCLEKYKHNYISLLTDDLQKDENERLRSEIKLFSYDVSVLLIFLNYSLQISLSTLYKKEKRVELD